MDDRDKMVARACISTAHDYLWDAYRQIREADEYFSDPQLNKNSQRAPDGDDQSAGCGEET